METADDVIKGVRRLVAVEDLHKKETLPQQTTPAVQQVEVRRVNRIRFNTYFAEFGERRQRKFGIIFNVRV